MRRFLRRVLGLGLLAGAGYAVYRALAARRRDDTGISWEPQPFPYPPRAVPRPDGQTVPPADSPPTPEPAAASPAGWVEPLDGACPASHPVKAKLASGIFHVPGGRSYDRTQPDRCYTDAAAATADGLRPAKA